MAMIVGIVGLFGVSIPDWVIIWGGLVVCLLLWLVVARGLFNVYNEIIGPCPECGQETGSGSQGGQVYTCEHCKSRFILTKDKTRFEKIPSSESEREKSALEAGVGAISTAIRKVFGVVGSGLNLLLDALAVCFVIFFIYYCISKGIEILPKDKGTAVFLLGLAAFFTYVVVSGVAARLLDILRSRRD